MSTFTNPVVRIDALRPNTNSDTLDIWDGPQGPCQVKRGSFAPGDLAVFVPAETMVPVERPEFSFLASKAKDKGPYVGFARIRGAKLRGHLSVGLILKAPAGFELGMDASEHFGTQKYVPPPEKNDRKLLSVPHPTGLSTYDVENLWRFQTKLEDDGGPVTSWLFTEKINGANWRWMRRDGVEYVGSRTFWHKPEVVGQSGEFWWNVAVKYKEQLAKVPTGLVVLGEVYGPVQDLHYGQKDVELRVFDIWDIVGAKWLSHADRHGVCFTAGLPEVPTLNVFEGSFKEAINQARALAVGKSTLDPETILEGVVLRPVEEMIIEVKDPKPDGTVYTSFERLIAKVISPEYLSRGGEQEERSE